MSDRVRSPRAARRRPTLGASLAVVALAFPALAHAADQIHWTVMGQTAVSFSWRGPETSIQFGIAPGVYTRTVQAATPSPVPTSSAGPFWEARITGLAENTLYYYRIGTGIESTFRTPPPRGTGGFWAGSLADIGSSAGYSTVAPSLAQVAADNPNIPGDDRPRIVVVPGDLTYGDDRGPAHVDQHFNDVMVWSRWAAYMPIWGNHEWGGAPNDDLDNYEGRFDLPNTQSIAGAPTDEGGPADDWYWFDYGNVRFVAFPEPYSGAWSDWRVKVAPIMAAAQSDPLIQFIVVFGHRPPYSSGSDHGGNSSFVTRLDELKALYPKIAMTLSGHSHHYERSDPAQTNGIVHIVTGAGGASCGGISSTKPSWSVSRLNHLQHLKIFFGQDRIKGYAVCGPAGASATQSCALDAVVDTWEILAPGADPGGEDPPPVAQTADGIHWTFTSPTSVTFDWRGTATAVRYGLTSAYTDSAVGVTPNPLPFSSAGPYREARITGLLPNTLYHYSIAGQADRTFRTPIPRGTSDFTVMALGDVGSGSLYTEMPIVQSHVAAAQPNFVLMLGDLTYGNPHGQAAVDAHFNDVMVWSRTSAYMPVWGNHEWDVPANDDLRNYKGRFELPNPRPAVSAPSAGGAGEDWYWFDYGNARFVVYPEPYASSSTWNDWYPRADSLMAAVSGDPAIQFIVTVGHRPAYSSGHHPGNPNLKGHLDQLAQRHPKYVLNLSAHSHNYERTHPQHGVVHIVAGGGGGGLQPDVNGSCVWLGGCPPPAFSAFRALRHSSLKLRFTSTGIEGTAICGPPDSVNDVACTTGAPMDTFRIDPRVTTADALKPAPASLHVRVPGAASASTRIEP